MNENLVTAAADLLFSVLSLVLVSPPKFGRFSGQFSEPDERRTKEIQKPSAVVSVMSPSSLCSITHLCKDVVFPRTRCVWLYTHSSGCVFTAGVFSLKKDTNTRADMLDEEIWFHSDSNLNQDRNQQKDFLKLWFGKTNFEDKQIV